MPAKKILKRDVRWQRSVVIERSDLPLDVPVRAASVDPRIGDVALCDMTFCANSGFFDGKVWSHDLISFILFPMGGAGYSISQAPILVAHLRPHETIGMHLLAVSASFANTPSNDGIGPSISLDSTIRFDDPIAVPEEGDFAQRLFEIIETRINRPGRAQFLTPADRPRTDFLLPGLDEDAFKHVLRSVQVLTDDASRMFGFSVRSAFLGRPADLEAGSYLDEATRRRIRIVLERAGPTGFRYPGRNGAAIRSRWTKSPMVFGLPFRAERPSALEKAEAARILVTWFGDDLLVS